MDNNSLMRCDCNGLPHVQWHAYQSQYSPRIICHSCGFNILFQRGDIGENIAVKQWNDGVVCRKSGQYIGEVWPKPHPPEPPVMKEDGR